MTGQYIAFLMNMRVRMLEKVQLMLSAAENSVSYLRATSCELVSALAGNPELKMLGFLDNCLERMRSGEDFRSAWLNSVKSDVRYLKQEDKALLISFGSFFGITDAEGQIANCRMHIKLAAARLNEAAEARDRYASLSCGMGIVCGVGAIIVLI